MNARELNFGKVMAEYDAVCLSNKQFKSVLPFLSKGKNLRLVARIPLGAATIHPEVKKYVSTSADSIESKKEIDSLLKKYPEFDMRVKSKDILTVGGFCDRRA